MAQAQQLPTADQFFGAAKPLPTADEFFGKPAPVTAGEGPFSSEFNDWYAQHSSIGSVLHAFGQGVEQGWGSQTLPGLSDETIQTLRKVGVFNKYQDGEHSIGKAVKEALIRPAAASLDTFLRGSSALFSGAQAAVAKQFSNVGAPQLGRDIAAMPEAFPLGGEEIGGFGIPHAPPQELATARNLGVIGEGEKGYFYGPEQPSEQATAATDQSIKAQVQQQEKEQPVGGASPETPQVAPQAETPAPDVHTVARQIAPQVFQDFDALAQRKLLFRRWIDELAETRNQQVAAQAPHGDEIADLQARLQNPDTTPRLAKKYQARLAPLIEERQAYIDERTQGDSPDMAKVRQRLIQTDYAMRDLAPQVGQAYRDAAAQMPQPEPEPEIATAEPALAPTEQATPAAETPTLESPRQGATLPPPETAATPAATPEPTQAQVAPKPVSVSALRMPYGSLGATDIAADVSRKLIAAGRPRAEAEAMGQVVASRYEARAARFNGAKGSALDFYNAFAPHIRGRRGYVAPVSERVPTTRRQVGDYLRGEPTAPAPASTPAVEPPVKAPLLPTPENPALPSSATGLEALDPAEIGVDAKRFQFKAGGDEAGVTDRLKGVETWDARLAGLALVYRDADGKNWIVDGHQRLGLAKRLAAAGQGDIRVNAFVLKQGEGVTDAQARVIAAVKNIAEGTGSAIDAAKIMREAADKGLTLPPLPPRSVLVRDGEALARLSPDAFGMAVNEVIPVQQAAIVGRLVDDPEEQAEAMRVLHRLAPDNARQAELIVRDLLASGTEHGTQESLFGEEHFAQSVVLERAKIADAAMKALKRDRGVFRTLVAEAERIQGHGENALDKSANESRLLTDEQAADLLTKLAFRAGPISDGLTVVARKLKAGEISVSDAAKQFLGTLRADIERSVAAGTTPGSSLASAAGERAEPEESDVTLFQKRLRNLHAEREAEGQMSLPGTERMSDAEQAQRGANAPLKAATEQRPMEDGLFGSDNDQQELFQSRSPAPNTERLAAALERIGAKVSVDRSRLSPSRYIIAERDVPGEEEPRLVEIRVSNHDQRPTYYRPLDYELGNFQSSHSADWRDALEFAAEKLGLDATAELKSAGERTAAAERAARTRAANAIAKERAAAASLADKLQTEKAAGRAFGKGAATKLFPRGAAGSQAARRRIIDRALGIVRDREMLAEIPTASDDRLKRIIMDTIGEPQDAAVKALLEHVGPERWTTERPSGFPRTMWANFIADDEGDQLFQDIRTGKLTIRRGKRNILTLFKNADASTGIHEFGHQWLEELMEDAADPAAPADLTKDAATVRDWLGVKEGEAIPRKAHEQFARSFETYMMEGRAPSRALARVFEQFRQWLTAIYRTVANLNAPITDDIRDVFDRLIVKAPERVVVAPDRETPKTFADIHEADAETTPPEKSAPVADQVRDEQAKVADEHATAENLNVVRPTFGPDTGTAAEARSRAPESAEAPSAGHASGATAGSSGITEEPGAVRTSGSEAAQQGARVPERTEQPAPDTSPNAVLPDRSAERLVDKAGNIRLDNLNTTEDLNVILRQTAEDNGDFLDQRGVVSDAEVLQLSQALGADVTVKDLNNFAKQFGRGGLAAKVMKLRQVLVQSAIDVRAKMAQAANGTEADLLAFAEAKARHQMIQGTLSAVTAEAGRALRAFRDLKGAKEAQVISDFLRDATGTTLFQLRREAQLGLALDSPAKVSKFVLDSARPTFGDMILEYWINGLISGPSTHTTYAIGNALLALWKTGPETAVGAAVGAVRHALGAEGERVMLGEVPAQAYGLIRGVRNGVVAAYEAGKTARTTMLPGELESMSARQLANSPLINPRAAIPNFTVGGVPLPVGTLARLPARAIAVIHSFFRAMNYEREMAGLAYRTATLEGLDGDKLAARVGELETNPSPELMEQARQSATDLTLMGRGGELTQALSRLTNARFAGGQWLKFIDPFVHISSNIIEQALLQRTPLGVFSGEIRAALSGAKGGAAQDMAIGRMAVGSALAVAAGSLAAEGLINGSGPSDPKEARVYAMVNGPPHSIRIGDTWYSVNRLGPLGLQIGVAADLYEFAHAIGTEDSTHVASLLAHAFTQNILDESFMRGPADLIKALTDQERYGASYVRNFLSSFVPYSVGMSQVAHGIDPYSRDARTLMDSIKAKVPWLSETLLPRYDIFGQEIPNRHAVGVDGLTAIYEARVNNDPVPQAMLRLGIFPAMPQRKIRGVTLTEDQYADYARLGGRMAKMRLDAIVAMPGFAVLPDAVQRDMMVKAVSGARETARTLVMMQNPAIIQQAVQTKLSRLKRQTVH